MRHLIVTFILCTFVVHLGYSADWPSFGKDDAHSRSTNELLSSSFTIGWKYNGQSEIVSSPAVADGFIVFGTRDGYVKALKESDGSPLWAFKTNNEIISSPVIYNGRVYIPSTDGKVYCLKLSDGTLIWNQRTGGTEMSSPIISNGVLFMGSGYPNQKVTALNIADKILVWEKGVQQIVYSSPVLFNNQVFIGCNSGRYYALDATNGSEIWSYNTGGDVLLSSPLVIDTSVYLLPGGTNKNFYSVDVDSANWAANWNITLTDSAPPVTGTIMGTKLAVSSPMQSANYGLVVFTVRFDYSVDIDPRPDYTVYQYVANEYVIAVDPNAQSAVWQQPFGSISTSDPNNIPSLGLCPTPAEMQGGDSGSILAVCSTLSSELRILDPSDGHTISPYTLDSPTRSSPTIANSHVLIGTKNGSLYAFQCADNHAPHPPVTGFSPANNESITSTTPTISWGNATDQDESSDNLTYEIRVDDDGEILQDADLVIITNAGETSITLPTPVTDNTRLAYAIRTIDSNSAYSEWSALQTFWIKRALVPPAPATNLRAVPCGGYVQLLWNASPSLDVRDYLISWKQQGDAYNTPTNVGNVTDYTVNGLTNGIVYTFRVIAEDYDSLQSSPVEINSVPSYPITLNGTSYANLADAINDAQSGDTIRLSVGTFILPSTLQVKEGVNIQGFSPMHTILNGTGLNRAFILSANNGDKGTLSNFTLYGAQVGIDTADYNTIIKNIIIRNCNTGIIVGADSNVDIINNTIINNTSIGINLSSANTNIRNNIIMKNGYGIYAPAPITPSNTYNDVYGNTTANYCHCNAGIGSISLDVIFNDEPNNDFREAIDQPTIDMGDPIDDYFSEPHPRGTRINMGAFGNTPYTAISGPFRIVTTTLANGETNAYYDITLSTVGGSGPITWSLTAGAIPSGLSLNTSGRISGTIELGDAGQYNFSLAVIDYLSDTATSSYIITVNPAPNNNLHIVTTTLPNGEVRAMYQASVSAANGFPPYSWSIIAGNLPPNVNLNSATGEISGTPPYGSDGNYEFTIKVTDADNFGVSKALNIRIAAGLASGSSGKGAAGKKCFIATAAYGSPLAPSVVILQQFRDEYLLTNEPGKWFVKQYYHNSPPLADYIANHKLAKLATQALLLPVVAYSSFMINTRLYAKMLTCLVVLIFGTILLLRRRKRKRA